MDFDETIKEIKRIYSISTNKDCEVFLSYKGTSGGIVKSFVLKIDSKEAQGTSSMAAALDLLGIVKMDLFNKISMMERQIVDYQKALKNE